MRRDRGNVGLHAFGTSDEPRIQMTRIVMPRYPRVASCSVSDKVPR